MPLEKTSTNSVVRLNSMLSVVDVYPLAEPSMLCFICYEYVIQSKDEQTGVQRVQIMNSTAMQFDLY